MSTATVRRLRAFAVTADTEAEAEGALAADRAIDDIRGGAGVDVAWLRFVELSASHGWRSTASRAYVSALAKRAAS